MKHRSMDPAAKHTRHYICRTISCKDRDTTIPEMQQHWCAGRRVVPPAAERYGRGYVTGALSVTRCGTAPAMPGRAEIEALYKKVYG